MKDLFKKLAEVAPKSMNKALNDRLGTSYSYFLRTINFQEESKVERNSMRTEIRLAWLNEWIAYAERIQKLLPKAKRLRDQLEKNEPSA
jgi:hypothetical protein